MFAVLALICFILALLGAGGIAWVELGLAFVAAHLAFGLPLVPQLPRRGRTR
jgi:hypothetical protein